MDPEELERFHARGKDIDALVRGFGNSNKPSRLLELLLAIRNAQPQMSEDGNVATFFLGPDAGLQRGKIEFRRVDGRWHLRN